MITKIITAALYATAQFAAALARAGERAVCAPTTIQARFWEGVGRAGEALERSIGGLDERLCTDLSAYMIQRAYGG
ncbi:hypothetical protein ABID58_005432 [Bradyrhizobium sp. S3.2.6]|uniref:hypothetical protein n=1 Tax=Bradyrhizobium sp. S3.2.6 TaxID=3156428 RepID=UPI003397492B